MKSEHDLDHFWAPSYHTLEEPKSKFGLVKLRRRWSELELVKLTNRGSYAVNHEDESLKSISCSGAGFVSWCTGSRRRRSTSDSASSPAPKNGPPGRIDDVDGGGGDLKPCRQYGGNFFLRTTPPIASLPPSEDEGTELEKDRSATLVQWEPEHKSLKWCYLFNDSSGYRTYSVAAPPKRTRSCSMVLESDKTTRRYMKVSHNSRFPLNPFASQSYVD